MYMRLSVLTSIRWLPALGVAWFTLIAEAQPSESGSATGVQFIEPKSAATNQAKSTESLSDLIGLDAGVRKPFEVFNANDSFSGAMTPPVVRRPPPSAVESKRFREALDRKKNWAFLTPEEIYGVQTMEEMLHLREHTPDGEAAQPKTSLERYLERMERSRVSAVSNQVNSDMFSHFGHADEAAGDQPADRAERSALGFLAEPRAQISGGSLVMPGFNQPFINVAIPLEKSPGGLFNIGQPAPTLNPLANSSAMDAKIKDYKRSLELQSPASSTFNAGFGVSASPSQSFSLGGPAPNLGSAQPPARSPLTTPAAFGVAVPSYTPAYSPSPAAMPAPMPVPVTAPRLKPTQGFEVPTRKF